MHVPQGCRLELASRCGRAACIRWRSASYLRCAGPQRPHCARSGGGQPQQRKRMAAGIRCCKKQSPHPNNDDNNSNSKTTPNTAASVPCRARSKRRHAMSARVPFLLAWTVNRNRVTLGPNNAAAWQGRGKREQGHVEQYSTMGSTLCIRQTIAAGRRRLRSSRTLPSQCGSEEGGAASRPQVRRTGNPWWKRCPVSGRARLAET